MSRSFMASRMAFCLLVFAAVYPLVTALAYLMQVAAGEWAIWQRHLVVVPIVVVAMVFAIIPGIRRLTADAVRRADGSEKNMSRHEP